MKCYGTDWHGPFDERYHLRWGFPIPPAKNIVDTKSHCPADPPESCPSHMDSSQFDGRRAERQQCQALYRTKRDNDPR